VGYIPPGESIYMCHIYSYFLLLYST
jgi:hypothetical protein